MRKRSGPIIVLSLTLAILVGGAALPGAAAAHVMAFNPSWLGIFLMVVPSDTLPGTSRTVPFVEDSNLNWGTAPDAWDVYRVHLTAGEVVEISVRGVGDQDIDCLLYDATATSLGTDSIANDLTTGRTSRLTHTVTATGYYSIAVKNADAFNTASYTIAVSVASAGDDLTPGDSRSLPLVEQDFVDAVSLGTVNPKPAPDQNDIYAVALTAGTPFVATLAGQVGRDLDVYLYSPGTPPGGVGDLAHLVATAGTAGTSAEALSYTPPVAGTYYIDVRAKDGQAGRYTLTAAQAKTATSITIKTNATTSKIGGIPILSGVVTPTGLVGKVIVVYVKKPGKSYWTYSSNRVVYSLYGAPVWQYKYYFKKGMAKGVYTYKAFVPEYTDFAASTSATTVAIKVK